MKSSILTIVLFFCLFNGLKAQDATFVNNNQSLLLLNPSFAGSNENWRVQSSYGNVNPNLSRSNILSYLSADVFIKPMKGAFALSYLGDNFYRGLLKDQRLSLAYAQHFTIGEKKIKLIPSIEFTYIQRALDVKSLTFGDPFWNKNPSIIPVNSKQNLDFSTGLLMNYKNYFGGFSIKHLNQPDIGFSGTDKLPASINIHASFIKSINEKTFVQFFTLFNHQGSQNVFSLNSNAILVKHLVLGLGLCSNAQTSMTIGYRNNYISCALSLGKNFSKLAGISIMSGNLSLAFRLSKNEQKKWVESFEKW